MVILYGTAFEWASCRGVTTRFKALIEGNDLADRITKQANTRQRMPPVPDYQNVHPDCCGREHFYHCR